MKRYWHLKLTAKATLAFGIFAGVLLGTLGSLAYFNGRAALQRATERDLASTASEKQAALDSWLNELKTDIAMIAAMNHFQDEVNTFLIAQPGSSQQAGTYQHLKEEMDYWVAGEDVFASMMLLDPATGQVWISTDPQEEGKFRENRPYFVEGRQGAYLQGPYYSPSLQALAMTASAPVYSRDGRLLVVLAGRVDMHELTAIVTRLTGMVESQDAYLVNTANLFVTQPRFLTSEAILRRGVNSADAENCLAGESSTILADDYRGVPVVAAYRWMPEPSLCLVVKIDQAEAIRPVRIFGVTLLGLSLLVMLAAIGLAFGLGRAITRPIQELLVGAQAIGQGNLDYRLQLGQRDEIGQLAAEFNHMVSNLAAAGQRNELLYQETRQWAQTLEARVEQQAGKIRASEAELRALLAALPDLVLVLDDEGRYLKIAPTGVDLLYRPPTELEGRLMHEILSPEMVDFFLAKVREALVSGQTVNTEYSLTIAGKTVWFAGVVSPMTEHSVVWAARDITERIQAEQILQQYAQELSRSNQELEQFAYVASHDLQEPLRMVSSYVQLLARRYQGRLDAEADDFIFYAVDGASRMKRLIDDLLRYSRVGTRGKEFQPTDSQAVLDKVLVSMQIALEENAATITCDPLPLVWADDIQLAQLFQNLIGNAIKFHREGLPPVVHISAGQYPPDIRESPPEVLFTIRDNGIGFNPQYSDRIFIIFERLHSKEQFGGTGIGLAICKKIVERHGGRIWVESQPGAGSTFYFTLKAVNSEQATVNRGELMTDN